MTSDVFLYDAVRTPFGRFGRWRDVGAVRISGGQAPAIVLENVRR